MVHAKQYWTMSFHKDGDHIVLHRIDTPRMYLKALASTMIEELVEHVVAPVVTSELAYRIPVGKRKWDAEYEMWDTSLGTYGYRLINKMMLFSWDVHDKSVIENIPITRKESVKIAPDMAFLYKDDDED